MKPKILIVGNPDTVHVGSHFYRAARQMDLPVEMVDIRNAYAKGLGLRFFQKLSGGKPLYSRRFNQLLAKAVHQGAPDLVLVTGIVPVDPLTLQTIRESKAICVNYLTDDPWNPAQYAPWFIKALPFYDGVFSPRKENLEELKQLGCKSVSYLPFAYEPALHYPERGNPLAHGTDVVFIGGADRERLPWIKAIIREKTGIHLYGGYWERDPETRAHSLGFADPEQVRRAVAGAKVSLCLVRRANRDGHSMRSFELPAMGVCMLTEDTKEHREIFGPEGQATVYFRTIPEMLDKLHWLLAHEEERNRFAKTAHELIVGGKNTYKDRLVTMLHSLELLS